MDDITSLPLETVACLEKAGISTEHEIFYHEDRWVYRRRKTDDVRRPTYPQETLDSLGPFEIHPVDISVVLNRSNSTYNITKIAHQQLSKENQPQGFHSPLALITLEGFARMEVNIPDYATHFCWLYPPFRDSIPNTIQFISNEAITLLRIGGFAYFRSIESNDEDQNEPQLLRVNSLSLDGTNGLVFDGPFPWREEYTEQLWRKNRFQPVTLTALREKGAQYFAFINPNEEFFDQDSSRPWIPSPNGAFVYLFNYDRSPHVHDCYFTVADNVLGVAAMDDR